MFVVVLVNFSVTYQVPQISFKIVAGDSMLVLSHEFDDIIFCGSLVIFESVPDYGSQAFALHITSSVRRHSAFAWTLAPNTWS